jgi:hypothetical protein
MQGNSTLAEQLTASQEGLFSLWLVTSSLIMTVIQSTGQSGIYHSGRCDSDDTEAEL